MLLCVSLCGRVTAGLTKLEVLNTTIHRPLFSAMALEVPKTKTRSVREKSFFCRSVVCVADMYICDHTIPRRNVDYSGWVTGSVVFG